MDDLINSIIEVSGDVVPAVPAVPTAQAQPKTRRRRVAPAAHVVPTEEVSACAMATSQVHRDTLAALVGGGQTKYLDRDVTSAKIETATSAEIEVLFARYELKLGAALTLKFRVHTYSPLYEGRKYSSSNTTRGTKRASHRPRE